MGINMKKIVKRIAVLLCICLIAPTVLNCLPAVNTAVKAEAAAKAPKAKLEVSKGTVGIASSPEYIWITNFNDSAKYTYTSSNKKVATVDKYGKITGVAKGSAKITVKEAYKGKTVTVGTYSVSVANSKLSTKEISISMFSAYFPLIQYQNFKAKYSGDSADPSIVKLDKNGNLIGLKAGKTTVTVKEAYKGKTRSLGKLTVTVNPPAVNPDYAKVTLGINQVSDPYTLIYIDNYPWDAKFTYEAADPTVVSITQETDDFGYAYLAMKGLKLGTTTVTIYCEFEGQKITVGTSEVSVVEIPITQFGFDSWFKDETGAFTATYYLGDDEYNSNLTVYLIKEPYNATTPVTFTSSDPSVATVDNNGKVTTLKEGTTEITATCGGYSDKLILTVADYDSY